MGLKITMDLLFCPILYLFHPLPYSNPTSNGTHSNMNSKLNNCQRKHGLLLGSALSPMLARTQLLANMINHLWMSCFVPKSLYIGKRMDLASFEAMD
jgi:hypothetical protein